MCSDLNKPKFISIYYPLVVICLTRPDLIALPVYVFWSNRKPLLNEHFICALVVREYYIFMPTNIISLFWGFNRHTFIITAFHVISKGPKRQNTLRHSPATKQFFLRERMMEVCGSSNVTLREFGCEQSLLSRPDGSASFIQGNDTRKLGSEPAVHSYLSSLGYFMTFSVRLVRCAVCLI